MEALAPESGGPVAGRPNPTRRKTKYIYTLALYYCFIACGLCFSIFNPTLIDLKDIFGTTLERASLAFPIRSAGYVIGSLSCGIVTTLFSRQLVLILVLVLKSLTIVSVPHWRNVYQFYGNAVFNGFFTAGIDTTVNTWVNEMWGTEGGPYMQALHFFFGIGSILGPILSEPFLSTRNETQFINQSNTQLLEYSLERNNNTTVESQLWIPYTISAITAVISAIIFLILFFVDRYPTTKSRSNDGNEESEQLVATDNTANTAVQFQCWDCPTIWLIGISGLFLIVYAGQETAYFQFSASFATETELHLSKNTAAFMASALALSFTITRAISIIIALKLSSQYMIYLDCLVILTANIIILFYANTNENFLWLANILMGVGFASIFPSFYPFIEKHLNITNIIGSIFIFCTGLSSCVCPLIVGLFIETKPFMLIYLCLTSTILTIIALILLQITVKFRHLSANQSQTNGPNT